MSLKEDIEGVKEQLNAEEKFLENSIIVERFTKKYKNLIFGAIGAVIVVVIAGSVYKAQEASKKAEANAAFLALQANPLDEKSSATLRTLNPQMLDLIRLDNALQANDAATLKELSESKNNIIADVARYQLATLNEDLTALDSYAMTQDALYKDYALLNSALLLMKQDKIAQAHQKLNAITSDSAMYKVAQSYLHYGIK